MIRASHLGKRPVAFFIAAIAVFFIGLFLAAAATAPVITSGPAEGSTVATSSVSFTFDTPGAVVTQCTLAAAAGATPYGCASPQNFTLLGDSIYIFEVAVQDGVGDWATTTRNFTVNASVTITASAGPNGAIAPLGAVALDTGSNQTFAITPDSGFDVADVLVDGVSVGATTSYSFINATADHTIAASFSASTPGIAAPVITSGPADGSTVTVDTVTFTFEAPSASSTQCSFGADPAVYVCFSPQVFSGLPNGIYTFSVAALSPTSTATTTRTFTVDVAPAAPSAPAAPAPAPVVLGGGSPGLIGLVSNGYGGFSSPVSGAAASLGIALVPPPFSPGIPSTGELPGTQNSFIFSQTLRLGSRGEGVMKLQERLIALGLFNHPVATGYFGPITARAVKAFQLRNNLPQIGQVGPLTRNVLNGMGVAAR